MSCLLFICCRKGVCRLRGRFLTRRAGPRSRVGEVRSPKKLLGQEFPVAAPMLAVEAEEADDTVLQVPWYRCLVLGDHSDMA